MWRIPYYSWVLFTFASVGHYGYGVKLKLCWTRNSTSIRVKETAIQNLAKFPWFNLGNVFSHGKYVIIYKSQYWCCRNSPPYWNSWQFPIITRLRNSSLVLLGRTSSSWDLGITPEGGHNKTQTVNHADCADHADCARPCSLCRLRRLPYWIWKTEYYALVEWQQKIKD